MKPVPARLVPLLRERLEGDLLAFAREVTDFHDLTDELHGPLAAFLVAPGTRKLILSPRWSYKSSLISVAFPLWRIARNRNIRILLDSDLRANAKKFLKLMRWHLEANPLLMQLWGAFKREPGWTDEEFTVSRAREYSEPTMMASGMDQVLESLHFDVGVLTDLVNRTNVTTADQRAATSDHRRMLSPILGDGEQILEGTRWDDDDEYGRILRSAAPGRTMADLVTELLDRGGEATFGRWQVFYRRWCTHRKHPKCTTHAPLIPKYTPAFIAEQREELQGYRFSANFDNDPIAAEFAKFKPDWVERFWTPPLPDGVIGSIVVDPAISERPEASWSAITAVAYDPTTRYRYCVVAWRGRVGDVALVDKLLDLYQLVTDDLGLRVFVVGVEAIAFQKIYRTLIRQRAEDRGMDVPLVPLPSEEQRRGKGMRIQRLSASFEALYWYLQRDQVDLMEELEKYPKAATRDLIDSLSYHLPLQQRFSRMVYPMWDPDRFIETVRPARFDRVAIGVFRPASTEDFGYAVLGRTARVWYLIEEGTIPRGTATPDLAATLYAARNTWKVRSGHVLVPHHEVELRKDLLGTRLPVGLARAYTDPGAPVSRLATLLERDRFRVLSYCEQFIREMGLFVWPDKPEGLQRRPDMKHVKVLGAVHTILWHEDPPEVQRWPKASEVDRVLDPGSQPAPPVPRRAYSTGYGTVGTPTESTSR